MLRSGPAHATNGAQVLSKVKLPQICANGGSDGVKEGGT